VLRGLQLWANLPAADKMMAPRYRDLAAAAIPEVALAGGGRVRVIAGELAGARGPVADIVIDPTLAVVELEAPVRAEDAAVVPLASGSHQAASMRCGPASRVSGPWYSGRWRCTASRCGVASSQVG